MPQATLHPTTQNNAFKKEVQEHRRRPTKVVDFHPGEEREEGREMDLNVAFGKGSGARRAANNVAAVAVQEVTPIQGSLPHHHDVIHRIRQDMA